jgi:hypothetical protein
VIFRFRAIPATAYIPMIMLNSTTSISAGRLEENPKPNK